eukprot:7274578-Alexandrium_andersonii.AAC.1
MCIRDRPSTEAGVRGLREDPGGHRLRRCGLGHARGAACRARRAARRGVQARGSLLGSGRRPDPQPWGGG